MFRSLWRVLPLVLMLICLPAQAQIIDRIEIGRSGKAADITIHFSTRIQYLRHGPLEPGKLLRVFIRLIDSDVSEADLVQQTVVSPVTDMVPSFSVTFPELRNGMLITFSRQTSWQVRPGEDGRSIVITVPVLPGARDVVAELRAPAEPAVAVAPAVSAPVTAAEPTVASVPVAPAPVEPVAIAVPVTPAPEPVPSPAPPAPQVVPPPTAPASQQAAATPSAPAEAAPATAPPVLTAAEVEAMATSFFEEAQQAVAGKDYARAVNRLNRVLGLPSNSRTEPAQALIGEVREATGEIAKARAEYELYLKVFPKGPAANRVKEHLAALPAEAPRQARARALPAEPGPAEWTYYGSLSQYLYKGNSHIEVTTPPPPGQLNFTTDELSMTDQNALISTVDLNARRRDGISDTRIVVRDTNTQNYLNRSKSTNRLYAAYIEQKNRRVGYLIRAGRQNPTGGGVLERFDGLNIGYDLSDRWRINGVAGIPVEFMSPYKKSFYGLSLDMQAQPGHVGFSTYFLHQHMDGVVNRQAVGIESRYFDSHAAVFGTLDYDLAYSQLNIAMLQGNYRTDAGTNYFTYFDHRKTPPLGLTNAIAGMPGLSVKQALDAVGLEQLRADAKALTATSDMLAVGVTHPYTQHWQLGTDYRVATISGTDAAGSMPAMPGSGTNHVISMQAIGNSLWVENDVGVINGSYIKGATYDGQSLGFNYVFVRGDTWRVDSNLRYYTQKDDFGERQKRWSPSLKVGYRWKLVTLEAEVGAEDVAIDGPTRIERSNRQYFFVGYRADFR